MKFRPNNDQSLCVAGKSKSQDDSAANGKDGFSSTPQFGVLPEDKMRHQPMEHFTTPKRFGKYFSQLDIKGSALAEKGHLAPARNLFSYSTFPFGSNRLPGTAPIKAR